MGRSSRLRTLAISAAGPRTVTFRMMGVCTRMSQPVPSVLGMVIQTGTLGTTISSCCLRVRSVTRTCSGVTVTGSKSARTSGRTIEAVTV